MLIVLIALVSLVNLALGLLPAVGGAPLTLQRMLGLAMAPLVWLAGIPWAEARSGGRAHGHEDRAERVHRLLRHGARCPRTA